MQKALGVRIGDTHLLSEAVDRNRLGEDREYQSLQIGMRTLGQTFQSDGQVLSTLKTMCQSDWVSIQAIKYLARMYQSHLVHAVVYRFHLKKHVFPNHM